MVSERTSTRRARLLRVAGSLIAGALLAVLPALPGLATQTPARDPGSGAKRQFVIQSTTLTESSNLALSNRHPGYFYSTNDSGHPAEIYALDTNGATAAVLTLGAVQPYDWEAIATGPNNRVWVGDIGDNTKSRGRITLYRFREPQTLSSQSVGWSRFRFRYPDGPHDAEALLVHPTTGRIYIVTKALSGAAIYAAPVQPTTGVVNELTKVADAPQMITDGAFLPDGSGVVLCSYGPAYELSYPDFRQKRQIALPNRNQGESLAVSRDGKRLYVGSEGLHSEVWTVPLSGAAASPSSSPKPTAKRSASPKPSAGGSGSGGGGSKDTTQGTPGWIPLTVVGVAVLAGLLAFPLGRRPGPRRPPQRTGGPSSRQPYA